MALATCTGCGETKTLKARGMCSSCYSKAGKVDSKSTATTRQPKRTTKKPTEAHIAVQVGTLINLTQSVAMSFPGVGEAFAEDALTDYEVGFLSRAIAGELLSSEQLLRLYSSLSHVGGPHARLAAALVAIAAPRLARRGALPEEIAAGVTGLALMVVMREAVAFDFPTVPMEAGPARGDYWPDGQREVVPGFVVPVGPPVSVGSSFEEGRHSIFSGPTDDYDESGTEGDGQHVATPNRGRA